MVKKPGKSKNKQPALIEQLPAGTDIQPIDINPNTMLATAVQQGQDLDKLEKLMDLRDRWEKDEARKAYVVAMNAFKKNPPEIFKDRHVEYTTDKGTTEYDHASLGNIVKGIGEGLAKHGLSHRWDIKQLTSDGQGGQIIVTCIITHKLGHSESVPLQSGADASGGKNDIQAKASTITYLQRYTLLAATGLAVMGQDDDGAGSEPVEYITESQVADLQSLIDEVGADKPKFCEYMKTTALAYIHAGDYSKAQAALEAKRGK